METERGRNRDSRVRGKQMAQRCPDRSTGTRLSREPHACAPPHFSSHPPHTQDNQSDPMELGSPSTQISEWDWMCIFLVSALLFEYRVLFYWNVPTSGYSLPPRQPVPLLSYSDFKKVISFPYTEIYLLVFISTDSAPHGRQLSSGNTQTPHQWEPVRQ